MNTKIFRSKMLLTIAITLVVSLGYLYFAQPFKIKDPSDPRFQAEKFRFEDYSRAEIKNVISKIIKPGMSKAEVDAILIKSANAHGFHIVPGFGVAKYSYCYSTWRDTLQALKYMSDERALAIDVTYSENELLVQEVSLGGMMKSLCESRNII